MTNDKIQEHMALKAGNSSYPSLPKYLLATTKEDKIRNKRLCVPSRKEDALGNYEQSLLRGFNRRVGNWLNDHSGYIKMRPVNLQISS